MGMGSGPAKATAIFCGIALLSVACGAGTEGTMKRRRAALALDAEQGDLQRVQELLSKKPRDLNQTGTDDQTALMRAARNGHADVVCALLIAGADPNIKERHYNQTALMLASFQGHAKIVESLLGSGADVNAPTIGGYTPLM